MNVMSKIIKMVNVMLLLLAINSLFSCNGSATTSASDSVTKAPMDSMPVIKPNISDTAGIITTPPVNDHNNIIPDSAH
jgi:hypothetical protein